MTSTNYVLHGHYVLHGNTDLKYFTIIDSLILKEELAIYTYNDVKDEKQEMISTNY